MQKDYKPKPAGAGQWAFALFIGGVLLYWFFSTRDTRTLQEKQLDEINQQVRERATDERVNQLKQSQYGDLIEGASAQLKENGVDFLKVEVAQSGCLWIYVQDNGTRRDRLAGSLCTRAKRSGISCVTIVDPRGNTLGRSVCR